MSKKLSYSFYPNDWGSSDSVFELNLSERGLYRELIDIAMMNENKVKPNILTWARKFNSNEVEVEVIVNKLIELKLLIQVEDYYTIPSCDVRLALAEKNRFNGKSGGRPKTNNNPNNNPTENPNNNPTENPNETQTIRQRERERERENKNIGGWEKVLQLFPSTKLGGEIDAIQIWNNLEQKEKQSVMRHLNPYLKNTEPQFVKQIGNYFKERMWESMKSKPSTKKMKPLDVGMIEWYMVQVEMSSFDLARTDLAKLQMEDEDTFNELKEMYNEIKKQTA